jgi:hypothetical protein
LSIFLLRTSPIRQTEVSRLLTAAVINQKFRYLLLTNPADAIDRGYQGEPFRLEREEKERILAIRAGTLADFARQLTDEFDFSYPAPTLAHRR